MDMRCLVVICVALLLFIPGCGSQKVPVGGSYYLDKFSENGRFYMRQRGDDSVGGVFDRYVLQMGAKEDVVLAYIRRLYRGDCDGWYVLDVKWGKVSGPLSDSERQRICTLNGITCEPVEAFWDRKKGLR